MDYVSPQGRLSENPDKRLITVRRLALASTFLAMVVIVLGAYTRLVDAGLGCPDWPGCYGFLTVPTESHEISIAESRFPDAPVEVEKGWPEMIHRYFAGVLGLFIFGITVLTFRKEKSEQNLPRRHLWALSTLVIIQALFGMWTVTLKLWPQVVTAHLLGGFATLTLLTLLCMRLYAEPVYLRSELLSSWRKLKPLAVFATIILTAQITLGGWTSSNYAALACPNFPTCQTSYWPEMDFRSGFDIAQTIGPNYLGGLMDNEARTAIHMSHRIGALIVFFVIAYLLWRAMRVGRGTKLVIPVLSTALLLALQIGLGVTNVVALLPLSIAVAHNAVAALLLISLMIINFYLWTAREVRS